MSLITDYQKLRGLMNKKKNTSNQNKVSFLNSLSVIKFSRTYWKL